jgi:hypothetical protein
MELVFFFFVPSFSKTAGAVGQWNWFFILNSENPDFVKTNKGPSTLTKLQKKPIYTIDYEEQWGQTNTNNAFVFEKVIMLVDEHSLDIAMHATWIYEQSLATILVKKEIVWLRIQLLNWQDIRIFIIDSSTNVWSNTYLMSIKIEIWWASNT